MPTGTGKTGVIAILSIGVPETDWSLILTPWKNLCEQLVGDLETRFWPTQNRSVTRRGGAANTSPLGSLRDANGLIYIRVAGRKLLCFEQLPESIFCVP